MNTNRLVRCLPIISLAFLLGSCSRQETASTASAPDQATLAGQSAVADNESQKNVVKVAVGSPDHTTLVAAVKAAALVDVLTNAGPFTVFAPTNAAFDKLPPGTVANLLKPENIDALVNILEYHVALGVYKPDMLKDGMIMNMANSGNIRISVKDGKVIINDSASVVGTVDASNGIIHVVDAVLLPPAAK